MAQNIALTASLMGIVRKPFLLQAMASTKFQPQQLITRHFTLDQVVQAYDTFDDEMKEEALKVIITNSMMMEEFMRADEKKVIPFPIITTDNILLRI